MCTPYKAKKWLPWQRPLVPGYRQRQIALCWFNLVDRSNLLHNQWTCRYHSHIASYSNFSPKIGCHDNDP